MNNFTNDEKKDDDEIVEENIKTVLEFYAREQQKLGKSEKILDGLCTYIDQPIFIYCFLLFISLWITINIYSPAFGLKIFDPPPFHFLQGIIGLSALLAATIVLSKQNRIIRIDEQRAHLNLKVSLITEKKTAKMIELLEELRLDLPNVKNRVDAVASSLQEPINADQVATTLYEIKDKL